MPSTPAAVLTLPPYECRLTPQALGAPNIDRNYYQCWLGLKSHFDPAWRPAGARQANIDTAGGGCGGSRGSGAAAAKPDSAGHQQQVSAVNGVV